MVVFALCGAVTSALCAVRFMPHTKAQWKSSTVKVLAASAALLVAPVCYARGEMIGGLIGFVSALVREHGWEGIFLGIIAASVVMYFLLKREGARMDKIDANLARRKALTEQREREAEQKKIEEMRVAKAAARKHRKNEKVKVYIPDIGNLAEVDVVEVLVKVGDNVELEAPLVVLESDKATLDVPSPADGTVTAIHVKVGDKVGKGTFLAELDA